jgi:hypothetical protein
MTSWVSSSTSAGDPVAGAEIHLIEPDGLIKLDGSVPRPTRAPTSQRSRGRALSGDETDASPSRRPSGPAGVVVVHESGIAPRPRMPRR